jgi:type IV pilus assembly protein PilA
MRASRGFTLLELLIVVAVIAILALLMIPSTVDTLVRDQVNEALPLADVAKKPVAAAWAATQAFPIDNAAAGLPVADKIVGNLVSAVTVQDGAIHITFGNRAHGTIKGGVLTVRPAVVADEPVVPVSWVCGFAPVPEKMTVHGENRTTLPPRYLPARCRGT